MKTVVIIVAITSLFLFGNQLSLEFIECRGREDPYIRPLSDTIPVMVPEPQSITWHWDSCVSINDSTVIVVSNYADSVAARMVKEEVVKSCAISCSILYDSLVASNAIILRRRGDWPEIPYESVPTLRAQAYWLKVNPDYCVVTGDDAAGLFHGAMTLKQLVAQHEGNCVRGVTIYDFPNLTFRGNRMAFSVGSVEDMKSHTDYFAALKVNKLVLESNDFWWPDNSGQIRAFFDWCRLRQIEPVPQLHNIGHSAGLLGRGKEPRSAACGEAVYRRNEHFCFLNDTARCLEDTNFFNKPSLVDIGFDSVSGNDFTEWEQMFCFSVCGRNCLEFSRHS